MESKFLIYHLCCPGVVHENADDVRLVASPIKVSITSPLTDLPPPMLGQLTQEVLRELNAMD
jgi:crotonobetainyl-CoA:carnitine CoA-transferase CaiB-like acyl-CoA transferase